MRLFLLFILMVFLISPAVSEDLKPGETWTYKAQYVVRDPDICSDIVNNATATANGPCSEAVDVVQDTARVHTIYNAAISLDKISDKSGKEVNLGDVINYMYYVANKGSVNLTDIDVVDDKIENVRYMSGDSNGDGWLNLSEIWKYEGNYEVEEDDLCSNIVNTAVAQATDPCHRSVKSLKDTVVAKSSCKICCENGSNFERIESGKQTALGIGNGKAENNRKIVSNQKGGV